MSSKYYYNPKNLYDADIWAIGIIINEVFTNNHPWDEHLDYENMLIAIDKFPYDINIPDKLRSFLTNIFNINHEKRLSLDKLIDLFCVLYV